MLFVVLQCDMSAVFNILAKAKQSKRRKNGAGFRAAMPLIYIKNKERCYTHGRPCV